MNIYGIGVWFSVPEAEQKINEHARQGWKVHTFTVTKGDDGQPVYTVLFVDTKEQP